MKKIIKYSILLGLLNFSQFNALPTLPTNALVAVASKSSNLANLKDKLQNNFQLPNLSKINLYPKALDSKKIAAISAISAIIDPTFTLGAMLGSGLVGTIYQSGYNYHTAPKPEDKIIQISGSQTNELKNYLWSFKNPYLSIDKYAKLVPSLPKVNTTKKLKNSLISFGVGITSGIQLGYLASIIGASFAEGCMLGLGSTSLYALSKAHSYQKSVKTLEKELQEPQTLAQLNEEFNIADKILSNENTALTNSNQTKK